MYLVILGWVYVAVLMALAEAFSSNGTILGAIVTLFFYGVVPVSLISYFVVRKQRRHDALRADEEAKAAEAAESGAPDAGGHAPGAAETGSVSPVREEK